MFFSFSHSAHQSACAWKQKERQSKLRALPAEYTTPLSLPEQKLHALSLTQLVSQCRSGELAPGAIMMAYAKKTVAAHSATNCVTDIMFEEALQIPAVANWGPGVSLTEALEASVQETSRGPTLMGVPVSVKDTFDVEGHDTTIGFSRNVDRPAPSSSSIVRLLQDAGALIHTKTTVPTGLLSVETASDTFGRTSNPYNALYSAGGSTGGGAALVACGGSKIEIGTDIGGSVRIPAHFCGIWSLKGSVGRFPVWGSGSSMMGLEGVPIVASPMAGSLEDLRVFWERVVAAEPWQYDHTCIPLPWRNVNIREEGRKLKWGVMWDEGPIPPTPACRRALQLVVAALRKQGHEVVDFQPPDMLEGLKIGYQLVFADGGRQIRNNLTGPESLSHPATALLDLLRLPKALKKALAFLTRTSDPLSSQLCAIMHEKSVVEEREIVARRDEYRAEWHKKWIEEGLDFVLSVPFPMPAIEHGASEKTTLLSAAYTFIFSILDYTAGVLPVTHVDKSTDFFPPDFPTSPSYTALLPVAKAAYTTYDVEKMHGLPLGVQIVGRRLEEEKVLEGMGVVEDALREMGCGFESGV